MIVSGSKGKSLVFSLLLHLFIAVGALTMIVPFVWMISSSLKMPGEIFLFPPTWIPESFQWKNYLETWGAINFPVLIRNSAIFAVGVTAGVLFTSSLAGYAFA